MRVPVAAAWAPAALRRADPAASCARHARAQARAARDPWVRLYARLSLAGLPRGGGNGDDIRMVRWPAGGSGCVCGRWPPSRAGRRRPCARRQRADGCIRRCCCCSFCPPNAAAAALCVVRCALCCAARAGHSAHHARPRHQGGPPPGEAQAMPRCRAHTLQRQQRACRARSSSTSAALNCCCLPAAAAACRPLLPARAFAPGP